MKVFIFTAGLGKRFYPFTKNTAKPALPFLKLPLVSFPLYYATSKIKNSSLILNLHKSPKSIKRALTYLKSKNLSLKKKKIYFSSERQSLLPLGSGGGLLKAKPLLIPSKHFVTINGDSLFFLFEKDILRKMIQTHIQTKSLATLLCTPFSNCIGLRGVKKSGVRVSMRNKEILAFESKPLESSKKNNFFHFTGVQIFSSQIFDFISKEKSHIFLDVLLPLLNSKKMNLKIKAFIEKKMLWFEAGNLTSYKKSLNTCLRGMKIKENNQKKENISATRRQSIQIKRELSSILKYYNQEKLNDPMAYKKIYENLKYFNLKDEIKNSVWLN